MIDERPALYLRFTAQAWKLWMEVIVVGIFYINLCARNNRIDRMPRNVAEASFWGTPDILTSMRFDRIISHRDK